MTKKTMKFKAEVNKLLDLMINSLYSNKEIFLRELISNSSDAIDKVRYEGLKNKGLVEDGEEFKIKITFNKDANTITIQDNGIGMNKDDVVNNLGTIAKSGTKEFFERLKEAKDKGMDETELIGQFGVGFYSSFMVADKIVVKTRKAGEPVEAGVLWTSDGQEKFSIEEIEIDNRGTEITLYMKDEDAEEFCSEWRIKNIIKKYSDYISYPIAMDIKRSEKPKDNEGKEIEDAEPIETIEEETVNSQKAVWRKDKSEVTEEEYKDFYRHISHDYQDPLDWLHFSTEGMLDYKALLYFPKNAPYDLFLKEAKIGVSLYVKNVFIMDDAKSLLPFYLRFIKGVVDSSDLPLNVSREILQEDKTLEKIKKNLVKKVLERLKQMKEKEFDKYLEFFNEFGKVIKEGIYTDFENRDKLADLLVYESSKTEKGKYTTLEEYVNNMKEDQKEIYYIIAPTREAAEKSPHLEKFKEKDLEVLYFIDPIDEFVASSLPSYKEKEFKSIGKGEVDLETEEEKKEAEETKKEYGSVLDLVKDTLKDEVSDVRLSKRLTSSAVCLVGTEDAMSSQMEKILQSMNQEVPTQKKILELNPKHPILSKLKALYEENKENPKIKDYSMLLFDQAMIAEGEPVKDPVAFNKRLSELMVNG